MEFLFIVIQFKCIYLCKKKCVLYIYKKHVQFQKDLFFLTYKKFQTSCKFFWVFKKFTIIYKKAQFQSQV